jgi:HPt (histidine-containing phosphotransfer) domain-containing protein
VLRTVELLDKRDDKERAAAIAAALDTMWAKFLPDIRERVRVLEAAGRSAVAGALSEEERAAAQSAAHKLAGTLGMFGLDCGTELARELEGQYTSGLRLGDAAGLAETAAEIRRIVEGRK